MAFIPVVRRYSPFAVVLPLVNAEFYAADTNGGYPYPIRED